MEVKGRDRYFDRAVRRLGSSCVNQLKNWEREITHQLFLLGCVAEMFKYASPPMAQTWCR